jgi:glucuronate isomerase
VGARGLSAGTAALVLHADRYFDADAEVRRLARELYAGTRELPLIAPHGHVEPQILAENTPFPEPSALLIAPDHYIHRMLYSRGIPLEALGIPRKDGAAVERDPRRIWRCFAEHYHWFHATPTGAWLDHQLHDLFGIRERLSGETAERAYDQIAERLKSAEFLPRALFERFNLEVLATTDAASASLQHHAAIAASGWRGRVIPTFRPDAVFQLAAADWPTALDSLGASCGVAIDSYESLVQALAVRRAYFKARGAVATDHGVLEPYTGGLESAEADRLFQRGLQGRANREDERRFEGALLMEMARMSVEDGLVMQLHAGAFRNHNQPLFERFGPDRGGDIPVATEWTRNLRPLLNAWGNDARLTLILFTLDEATYSRELAPLAGHYPAVRLGPPWWFHDSIEGMTRFRETTSETAGLYNTAGFNDDTRGFCSIPARHDLSRRVDANWLARLVSRHVLGLAEAHQLARALAYELPREAYRLSG